MPKPRSQIKATTAPDKPQSTSPIQQRLFDANSAISKQMPAGDEIGFLHSTFCQIGLPYKDPGAGVDRWTRKQGRAFLSVKAFEFDDPFTGEVVKPGLPFGEKARLVLIHFNTEAVRNQSPIIDVEDSMTTFVRVMLDRTPNARELNAVRNQLARLSSSIVSISAADGERGIVHNTQIVDTMELWYPKDPSQRVLWQSRVQLSEAYFQDLVRHAVPLDQRAVRSLSNTALGLDLYTWFAQRLHRIPAGKSTFIPWGGANGLHEQFGYNFTRLRKFREFFLKMLDRVREVYRDARFEVDDQGLTLWNSPPPVLKTIVQKPALQSSSS